MAEFDLEKIKIGDDVYKIAAGGGPNVYICTEQTSEGYLDLPSSVGSLLNLKVGDIIFYKGRTFSESDRGIAKFITYDNLWRYKWKLNVVNAGGETGQLSRSRAYSLVVTEVTKGTISVYITLAGTNGKFTVETSSNNPFPDAEWVAKNLMDYIGGGSYESSSSNNVPTVMKKNGEIWQAVDNKTSYKVYDSCGKLAYIVHEYFWGNINGTSVLSYTSSGSDYQVTAVLGTTNTPEDQYVTYDVNASPDIMHLTDYAGPKLYSLSNGHFGGRLAIFGLNGYNFG